MRYLVGSKLLGLENAKDSDYIEITSLYDYKRVVVNGEDIFYRSVENIQNFMAFNVDLKTNAGLLISNYQLDQSIIGQNFPIKYNLLDYKDKLKELLKIIVENKLLNLNKRISVNGSCSKILYNVAYNVFILQNGTTTLTAEQKAVIQQLHDNTMPISYIGTLEKMILNL